MRLQREPRVPTQFQLHHIAGKMLPKKVHPSWAPYLGLEKGSKEETAEDLFDEFAILSGSYEPI